mmetsp:Transcript_28290/g.51062  ORF Transcript_28290/g.51062 Transcript_28290/m.51062 type:complete len:120 (+) Transcript_28290:69-428(+)
MESCKSADEKPVAHDAGEESLENLADRALRVSERRRASLQRLAETRKKVQELGARLGEQEVLLMQSEEVDIFKEKLPDVSVDGPTGGGDGYSDGDGRRRLPRLRGNYPTRRGLAEAALP